MDEVFYKAWRRSAGLDPKTFPDSDALRHTAENIRDTLSLRDVVHAETLMKQLDFYHELIDDYCLAHEGSPMAEKMLPYFDCASETRADIEEYLIAHAPHIYETVKSWFVRPPALPMDEWLKKYQPSKTA